MPTVKGSLADSLGGEVGEKEKEGFVLAEPPRGYFFYLRST
jgi:hypothetical protein